eukprot:scaffold11564_cov180-Ochromonas_danica.AAC.9
MDRWVECNWVTDKSTRRSLSKLSAERTKPSITKAKTRSKSNDENKNDRHEGFARGHPPYYWPRLSTLNFLDLTG